MREESRLLLVQQIEGLRFEAQSLSDRHEQGKIELSVLKNDITATKDKVETGIVAAQTAHAKAAADVERLTDAMKRKVDKKVLAQELGEKAV